MDQVWRTIATEVAWAFAGPIVTAAVTALTGWLVFWWQKLFKSNFDEKARATIQGALERGMLHAIQTMKDRQGHSFVTPTAKAQLLSDTASYVEKWSGGTAKAKSLTHSDLMELAVPHLPLPPGIVLPGKPGDGVK